MQPGLSQKRPELLGCVCHFPHHSLSCERMCSVRFSFSLLSRLPAPEPAGVTLAGTGHHGMAALQVWMRRWHLPLDPPSSRGTGSGGHPGLCWGVPHRVGAGLWLKGDATLLRASSPPGCSGKVGGIPISQYLPSPWFCLRGDPAAHISHRGWHRVILMTALPWVHRAHGALCVAGGMEQPNGRAGFPLKAILGCPVAWGSPLYLGRG